MINPLVPGCRPRYSPPCYWNDYCGRPRFFPPGDTTCETLSRWRLTLEARDALLAVIAPALKLRHLIGRGKSLARALRVNRPKRPMQMSKAAMIFRNA